MEHFSDRDKKENLLSVLVHLSTVDGHVSTQEMRYLEALAERMGVAIGDLELMISGQAQSIIVPEDEVERMTIFYYMIFLVKSDGILHREEKDILVHYGIKLGFNPLLIYDVIQVLESYIDKKMPPNAIIDQVRKYLN